MKNTTKTFFIAFFLVAILFLAGCAQNTNLPKEPTSPNDAGAATGKAFTVGDIIPTNYAVPWDIFDNNKMILKTRDPLYYPDGDFIVTVNQDEGVIYNKGYYFNGNTWVSFKFPQETISGTNWIRKSAYAKLDIADKVPFGSENYVLAYSCKLINNEWKCGCRDKNDCGHWMIQQFTKKNSTNEFCNETDGGINFYKKGITATPDEIKTDYCYNYDVWLTQNETFKKTFNDKTYIIKLVDVSEDGAACDINIDNDLVWIKENDSYDENGLKFKVLDAVPVHAQLHDVDVCHVVFFTKEDYNLKEFYCSRDGIMSDTTVCDFGCVDGACVKAPALPDEINDTKTKNYQMPLPNQTPQNDTTIKNSSLKVQ